MNAELFDPEPVSPGKKRTNEGKDASTSKKRTASSDEVRLQCRTIFYQDSTKEKLQFATYFVNMFAIGNCGLSDVQSCFDTSRFDTTSSIKVIQKF